MKAKYYTLPYASFTVLAICSVDFLTPTLPQIAKTLQINSKQIQLSIAIFFTCYALSTLPFAYYSEKIGRFRCLKAAIIMSFFGHLCCAMATSYYGFILGRCLAGIGAGGLILLVRCIQADRFFITPDFYRNVTIWITIWTGLFSDSSKIISNHLITSLPWQYMYLFLCILSLLAFIIAQHEQVPLDTKITHNYTETFQKTLLSPLLWLSVSCYALANGSISLILSEIILDSENNTLLFSCVALFFIIGRLLNTYFNVLFKPIEIVFYSICVASLCLVSEFIYQDSISSFLWLIPYATSLGCLLPNSIILSAGLFSGRGFSVIYSVFSLGSLGLIAVMCYMNAWFNQSGLAGLNCILLGLCLSILLSFTYYYSTQKNTLLTFMPK